MTGKVPQPGEVWILHDAFENKWPPLLILERDPDLPRWIACDPSGQKMGLWDSTVHMYHEIERPLNYPSKRQSRTQYRSDWPAMRSISGRAALAQRARW